MKYSFFLLFSLLIAQQLPAQFDTIRLVNPSFEGQPQASKPPFGWLDCGFKGQTPPDVQPSGTFSVTRPAYNGNTYLGMVVRNDDTYERVSQKLSKPLKKGDCYDFSIYLCRSDVYVSPDPPQPTSQNYTTPAVLRIWGCSGYCSQKEMLAASDPVTGSNWTRFDFKLSPQNGTYYYIELEAFYKTPVLFPYNGNILVDHASDIVQTHCPGEEPIAAGTKKPIEKKKQPTPQRPKPKKLPETKAEPNKPVAQNKPQEKILKELDRKTIQEGQIIQIEQLYFKADSSTINPESDTVLAEIYQFLADNKDVKVEIGGHTNGLPSHEFCDRLSKARAKAVAEKLIGMGIDENRLEYRGYGKRKPIATNRTKAGRKKNQRVEIKILDFES